MLTVAVNFEKKKNEKPLWYKNMIRTSRDGMVTIMVVETAMNAIDDIMEE